MVEADYTVRRIEPEDREKHLARVERAQEIGDEDEVSILEELFAKWEKEQGERKTSLVCSVCRDPFLTPTQNGRARRHINRSSGQVTWDRVWLLMKQIETLQAELDRTLRALEPSD